MKNKENLRQVLDNIFSLAALQALNYILPILMLPFFIRTIGMDNVGVIATAIALVTYFQMIGEYGFNLTATRDLAKNKSDKKYVNDLFTSIMHIKLFLLLIGFFIYYFIVINVPMYSANENIFLSSYMIAIGQTLFPTWFFQGMERMRSITILNSLSKIIGALLIVLIVKTPSDTIFVPMVNGIMAILVSSMAYFIIFIRFNVRVIAINVKTIRELMSQGFHIFLSRVFSTFYKNSNIIILGFFVSPTGVGVYSILEKIIRSIQMVQNVLGDAVFPYLNGMRNNFEILNCIYKYSKKVFLFYLLISLFLVLSSPLVSLVLIKGLDISFIIMLCTLSSVFVLGGMSYYFGILGLVSVGKNKQFSISVMITGGFNIITCTVLSYLYAVKGTVASVILSELLLLILIFTQLNKIKKEYESNN